MEEDVSVLMPLLMEIGGWKAVLQKVNEATAKVVNGAN